MSTFLPVPIGITSFKEMIESKSYYVDKTLLIKEFWVNLAGSKVILAPRPRRFGKTLNLSMLKFFFERTEDSYAYLFEKTNIWKDVSIQAQQGQWPIIFITFKDIKEKTWEEAYIKILSLLIDEIKRTIKPIFKTLDEDNQTQYHKLTQETARITDYKNSLKFMTEMLQKHYKKEVIVLIDEYDTPIITAHLNHYYENMVDFIRGFLSPALKDNEFLKKAFLTGITRTAKEGIFSGLNNFNVCTMLNETFSDKFGFTQEEVDQILNAYNLDSKREEIKAWYNGYYFGNTHIYNPWSIVHTIEKKGELDLYWANTSDNALVISLIARANNQIKDELEKLLIGTEDINKEIDEGVTLKDIKSNPQSIWSLLLFTGYLTTKGFIMVDPGTIHQKKLYKLTLPNREIIVLYQKLITGAITQAIEHSDIIELFSALTMGDTFILEKLLQEFIRNICSYHDLPKDHVEMSIHLFVLGLLAGLNHRFIIQSNRESGEGRYDIMLMPRTEKDYGIVIEFKKSSLKTLNQAAQKALKQIQKKDYIAQLRTFGYQGKILCYGIATTGKKLLVKMDTV